MMGIRRIRGNTLLSPKEAHLSKHKVTQISKNVVPKNKWSLRYTPLRNLSPKINTLFQKHTRPKSVRDRKNEAALKVIIKIGPFKHFCVTTFQW